MKKIMLVFVVLLTAHCLQAQENNPNAELMARYRVAARKMIRIPDIAGYKVLKGDFHIHTVNSDGNVIAALRVEEAWEEGLDVIAITDHVSHTSGMKDENNSYNQAIQEANRKGIVLIRGCEVAFEAFGHANFLFVNDANKFQTSDLRVAFNEAKTQDAFIHWNHPGWAVPKIEDEWKSAHTELLENGMLHGIEIFCELEYYPVAADWCYEKNLTFISNSDTHVAQMRLYDFNNVRYRPMTLILAKDNSQESIKDAMLKGRTIAYYFGRMTGKKEYLDELVNKSVSVEKEFYTEGDWKYHRIINHSDLDYTFIIQNATNGFPSRIDLPAGKSTDVRTNGDAAGVSYLVDNVIVGKENEKLQVTLF